MKFPIKRSLAIFCRRAAIPLAAGAITAALAIVAPARATDLYDDGPPPPRTGSAYDDPRYADLYGNAPPPRAYAYRPDGRPDLYRQPLPPERVYRDDDAPPSRYGLNDHARRRGCASKDEISAALDRDGWSGFINPQVIDRDTATVDARRPSGRPFRLEIDRCTGEILAARPLDEPRYGPRPYSYGYGPYAGDSRRYLRPY